MITVRRVMPILTVSELEASRDAYVRILGLHEVMNHGCPAGNVVNVLSH
jgi:catechol 2,3-dioxygenase-like lactoylglutathione lyase family enzyme